MSASLPGALHGPTQTQALLSRHAENIVWLARYMERIENLARIIDVTETFTRTSQAENGWRSLVQINADEARYHAARREADMQGVAEFYVLDHGNPASIASLINASRENARTQRPLIATEMWTHVNVFHGWVRQLTGDDIRSSLLSGLCARLKQECQTHNGIIEGTFYRDQGWYFYMIGKYLERGDQTTRLVDIKYHTLLPREAGIGSQVDISQWSAVLRSAAAYHAYRRVMPRALTPSAVAGFLLLNNAFPRSLVLTLRQVHGSLSQLRIDYGLRQGGAALERLEELQAALSDQTIEQIILRGLHEFLDWVQVELRSIQDDVADAFWSLRPVVRTASAGMTQSIGGLSREATQSLGDMRQTIGDSEPGSGGSGN